MFKTLLPLCLAAFMVLGNSGCKKPKPKPKPGDLTPAERVRLKKNAISAYEKIVNDYPDSPHAAEAARRLSELQAK